jgi:hypothetical protein
LGKGSKKVEKVRTFLKVKKKEKPKQKKTQKI